MEYHRFHLEKYHTGSKTKCPSCGRKRCFVRYIDEEGEVSFPSNVGRCDHEDSCGYHYSPKEFFQDNPTYNDKWSSGNSTSSYVSLKSMSQMTEQRPIGYIDDSLVAQSLTHYKINPLHRYLYGMLGEKNTNSLFLLYNVGTSKMWGGSTIFWQKDVEGKYRTGKIMRYDSETGHRVKDNGPAVSWAHSALKLPDFNLKQCFFGEHLLSLYPNTHVMIVESEKTALICRYFMPEYVWIATGGKNGCFNWEAIRVLKDREVTLFPDLGAFETWQDKMNIFRSVCQSVSISRILEDSASGEQRDMGLDLADFLLSEQTPQMICQQIIDSSPGLKVLVDKLELEFVRMK